MLRRAVADMNRCLHESQDDTSVPNLEDFFMYQSPEVIDRRDAHHTSSRSLLKAAGATANR
jgi:hypothetical protein